MLSMIVSWYNRHELQQALPSLVESMQAINGEIIIVNFGGDKSLLNKQIGDFKSQITVINLLNTNGKFNKPTAQNIGAHFATQPYLFFCDNDIILSPAVITELFSRVQITPETFGTVAKVNETKPNARGAGNLILFGYELRLKIADGTEVRIIDNEEDANDGSRQAPGLLLVKKSDFKKINGYNSELEGWGWEDQDIICRLHLAAKLKRITYGLAMHISHDEASRMMAYSTFADRWQSRDHMFRCALANYDKNYFVGTYADDINKYSVTVERPICAQKS